MILHTFNKTAALEMAVHFISADDQVLLIEDGVYALLDHDISIPTENICVLEADIITRGIATKVNASFKKVSYQDFVQMCCDADSVSNWS
jgi:sulfur relay protein TusB/DsrH